MLVRAPIAFPEQRILSFLLQKRPWIEKHLFEVKERLAAHPEPTAEEIEALRRRAKEFIPPRVAHFAAIMGVTPTGIRITSARRSFGSCSPKNALSFSLFLMRYPDAAIDYVIVHELAHIRHHNHSAAFHREVARYLPDCKERRKLLKK